jgi:hypothetical protein
MSLRSEHFGITLECRNVDIVLVHRVAEDSMGFDRLVCFKTLSIDAFNQEA